jgi:hypothetical protein
METKTVRQVGQDLLRLQERLETEKGARWARTRFCSQQPLAVLLPARDVAHVPTLSAAQLPR